MAGSSNALRLSGLNSGLDTEAIVKALTANTQLKINTQQRKVLKLQAQQEAYREIIGKFQAFQNKYLDILNSASYLKSPNTFNQYTAKLSNAEGTAVKGVSVTPSGISVAGDYNVTVKKVATQSTYLSGTANKDLKLDLSAFSDENVTYALNVTLGSESKAITFTGSSDVSELTESINQQLKEAFGTKNNGDNLLLVEEDGVFTTSTGQYIAVQGGGTLNNTYSFSLTGLNTGVNSFLVQVGNQMMSVSFQSISDDYFDAAVDADGNPLEDLDDENQKRATLFKQYAQAYRSKNELAEDAAVTKEQIVEFFNSNNLNASLGALRFSDGTKTTATITDGQAQITAVKDGNPVSFAITANESSENTFGLSTGVKPKPQIAASTALKELGLTPDSDGNYTFSINGVTISVGENKTIRDVISAVNASSAGVTMNYSSLTGQFSLTANAYGTAGKVELTDGAEGLLAALGLTNGTFTQGQNLEINVNGIDVEATSNTYSVDGTTFTFTKEAEGTTFTSTIAKDNSKLKDLILGFVNDYNKLISEINAYIDEKPNKDYHFLTDTDIEDMDLSDKQVEKWETMAKKGLLYNDSTLKNIMTNLRTAMYSSVTGADGNPFGLYSMGITTSSAWTDKGKLLVDEAKLTTALESNLENVAKLFTDLQNGIMTNVDNVINNAIRTTGERKDKGILIQKAGLATGLSSTDNYINDQIKTVQKMIDRLQTRYESQQNRYWAIYANMESRLASLNNQTNSLSQLLNFQS